jgi:DNA (cytosine-5)-methyltransferase 1
MGDIKMHLNKVRVKEAMERQGIKTQTELAEKLGITKNQLSVMLSENYNPVKTKVVELCNVLEVSAKDIIDTYEDKDFKVEKVDKNDVTAIELFAGAGGLALGLEQAGIHTLEFVEINKACCETLRQNRPNWNVLNEDIAKVDFSKYKGKVDIVTGGVPCQPFSYSGKKLGFEDTRGTLFHEFARCVKEVQPLIFMLENVKGMVSHDEGRTLQTIKDVLTDLGYSIEHDDVLNAVDYGVAQKRQRLVLIGTRDGVKFTYPKKADKKLTLRDALMDCPVSEGQEYSEKKRRVFELVPPGGCWVDLPEEIQISYLGKSYNSGGGKRGMARRISWDEPCLTLTCSPSQKQTDRCHPEETRPFTVREYARIQSFPDDWEFAGSIGDKYRQIGNAVPVEMARRIGIQLVQAVNDYKVRDAD